MAGATTDMYVESGRWPHWKEALLAGLSAGAVFLLLELLMLATVAGANLWDPPRLIAAVLLGREVLLPPTTADPAMLLTALAVHGVLSLLYGLALAVLVFRSDLPAALAVGALFGLALYLLNFFLFAGALPWLAEARNWITVFNHMVFGVVLAWSYKLLARRSEQRHALRA